MKCPLLLISLLFAAASATLKPQSPLLDGHKNLHSSMEAMLAKLHSTDFAKELNKELHRSRQALALHVEPFLSRSGIRIINPGAYHSLLHHMMYQHGRSLVNTSKALDGMAESAVIHLKRANMLKQLRQLSQMQTKLANFFHTLHSEITNEAKALLVKHHVHLGTDRVHFLMHISARAIFSGKTVKEAVMEHLRVVLDKPLPAEQHRRLVAAAVELSHNILIRVKRQLHSAIRSFLVNTVTPEATHPIFMASAHRHLDHLLRSCHKSLKAILGNRYEHYKALESKAFNQATLKKVHVMIHIHRLARPIMREHMKRVALILKRYGHHPRHSLVHYLGTVHLRPKDEEPEHLPWYACFLRRMHSVVRVAWLVVAIVFGSALLSAAVWVIMAKCRSGKRKTVVVVEKKKKCSKITESECPTKLPYVTLVEEKVPPEAVA